ncbi:MAG: glutaredoxin family protein [Cyanobacteriota bacterium]
MSTLMRYSLQCCCLCEGLEERLRQILPPGALQVVDVDGDPALQARYGLSVPVLARAMTADGVCKLCELPPVPPRLQGERLLAWLERHPSP